MLIDLQNSGENAPERLRSTVLDQGLPAFLVAYEARLSSAEAFRNGELVLDKTMVFADEEDGPSLPKHLLFMFMESEDGTSSCRVYEVVGSGKKRLGGRVKALEADAASPFSGIYASRGPRH